MNELLRRLQCEQYIHEVVQKEGALDGSTSGSIRAAFALFVSTPYITGEEFKTDDGRQGRKPKVCDIEIIDQIKHKNKGKGHGYKGHGSKKGCSSGCGGSTRHIPTKQTVEIAN